MQKATQRERSNITAKDATVPSPICPNPPEQIWEACGVLRGEREKKTSSVHTSNGRLNGWGATVRYHPEKHAILKKDFYLRAIY